MKPYKIFIWGLSGSGKSRLAKKLSKKLRIKHYDLDDIFWKKKFTIKRDKKDRIKLLNKILKNKKWIIEGVYYSWIEQAFKKSNLVIWLDIPLPIIIWRIFKRFFDKKRVGESLHDMIELINEMILQRTKYRKIYYNNRYKLINKHKPNIIIIKNKKQLNNLINKF